MATNQVFVPGHRLGVAVTDPSSPTSGAAVRLNKMTGVALVDEDSDTGLTTVDFGPGVYTFYVDDNVGSGIAIGDSIWYHDTETGSPATNLNNDPASADAFFGYALATVGANATTSIRVKHAENGQPGTVTNSDIAAAAVGVTELTANMQRGHIPLPLTTARVISSNAIQNTTEGGVPDGNTDPSLARINGATDKALQIAWAAASVVEIQFDPIVYPQDLDDASAVEVHLLIKKNTNTDNAAVVAVGYFEGVGDTNAGGNTAALATASLTEYTVTIAAGDVGAHPKVATVTLTPGTHANDAIHLMAAWVEYTKRD